MRPVYLDNNATTAMDPAVIAAMMPFFADQYGNPSSQHGFGAIARDAMREARRQVQRLLGAASEQEIIFTSGATEANNTALRSALDLQGMRNEIVTTAVEHPAILALAGQLQKVGRARLHVIGVDGRGRLDLEAFERALGPRTAIVSAMGANNETGTLFPLQHLAALTHAAGALFHTDAVQMVGRQPVDLKASDIDMLSFSAHKLHGPKGIGVLYLRKGTGFQPLLCGGRQERGRRGGTENVPAIIGLGLAAEIAMTRLAEDGPGIAALRDQLEQGLIERIDHCRILGDLDNRLPNTSCLAFDRVDGDGLLLLLDRAGIAASSGAACASGAIEPSHVLRAMRVPQSAIGGAIRFSLSRHTTIQDVNRVLAVVPDLVSRLRAASPPAWDRAAADSTAYA